jgi:hypothetical protein
MKLRFESYCRIYFERSNGMAVIDTGQGTPRTEVIHVVMRGTIITEHGPDNERPRFWNVAKNCWIKVLGDTAYVTTE